MAGAAGRSGLRIGFIGAGNMTQAMARGFIKSGLSRPTDIIASSPAVDQPLLDQMASLGCNTTHKNSEAAANSELLLLAVKPHILPRAMQDIRPVIDRSHLLVSVALGVQIEQIQKMAPPLSRVIRVMPNTPALVQEGASVFCRGDFATQQDCNIIRKLFSAVGVCEEADEALLDGVTGVSGSGPAYMYLILEAMADGGVKMGLPRNLAQTLAAQTMMGAAKMVLETGKHPGQLKDEVCSPGGCTVQAVASLERSGVRSALIGAVEAATLKSLETSAARPVTISQAKDTNVAAPFKPIDTTKIKPIKITDSLEVTNLDPLDTTALNSAKPSMRKSAATNK